MIKPEQIPNEAVYAVADVVMGDNDIDCLRKAIAAAINAWPGLTTDDRFVDPKVLCLPLREE